MTLTKLKKRIPSALVFFVYANKEKHPVYVPKKCYEEKHVDLLLIEEEGKRHYVLIKYFNTLMYDYTLHRGKKHLLFTSFQCRRSLNTSY